MKTMSKFNPSGSSLTKSELNKFEHQQYKTLELLSKAIAVDLTKTKTKTTIRTKTQMETRTKIKTKTKRKPKTKN